MKKKTGFTILSIIVVLVQITFIGCKGDKESSSDKQVIKMLKDFYTSYITEIANDNVPAKMEQNTHALLSKYCTKHCLDSINRLTIDELDWDPFICAQDASTSMLSTLSIQKDPEKSNFFDVSYKDNHYKGKFTIHLKVIKQKQAFKISGVWDEFPKDILK